MGNGDGTFADADSLRSGEAPHDFGIADLDGDDHQALVVPCRDDNVVWVSFGAGAGPVHVAVARESAPCNTGFLP